MGQLARFQPKDRSEANFRFLPLTGKGGRHQRPPRGSVPTWQVACFWPQKWQVPVSDLATCAPSERLQCGSLVPGSQVLLHQPSQPCTWPTHSATGPPLPGPSEVSLPYLQITAHRCIFLKAITMYAFYFLNL